MRFGKRDAGHKASPAPGHIEDVPFTTDRRTSHLPPPGLRPAGEQLSKAERMLGIPHRQSSLSPLAPQEPAQTGGQPVVSEKETVNNNLWSTADAQEHQPMDTARSPNGGLKPWPSLQSKTNHASMHDMLAPGGGWAPPAHTVSITSNNTPRHQIPHRPSDSTLRSHYEASRQPLSISQQTSDSAVRDMALRKGSSSVSAGQTGTETERPLRSALKQPSHQSEAMENSKGKKEGLRFPKLGNWRSKQNSSNNSLRQPSQQSQYGSSLSVNSPASTARSPSFSQTESLHSPAPASVTTDHTARPKVFENDVFDSSKVHVRRPPKGITNWFDGLDISSDEESQTPGEALPSTFSPYQETPQPTAQHRSTQRNHPVNDVPMKQDARSDSRNRRASRQPSRPIQTRQRNVSDAFVEENAAAIDLARQQMQAMQVVRQQQLQQEQQMQKRRQQQAARNKRQSGESFTPSAFSCAYSAKSGYDSLRHGGDSRLAHSRLGDESMLSLSDNSDDDRQAGNARESVGADSRYTADVRQASPVSMQRPSMAPRPYMNRRTTTRASTATTQTSGSIPIHWSNDTDIPAMPRRVTEDSVVDHTSEALHKLTGRYPSVRQPRARPPSSKYESESSVAGETVSSLPSEISRMMAVTEEEMALLEMMRQKRADMQKGMLSESAQQSLKQEEEQLLARKKNAQIAVKKLLKTKEEREGGRSMGSSHETRPDGERIAGLSSLREEDADEHLRIERFLASETPLEEVFPFPSPPHQGPDHGARQDPAPMEDLLLPRTYTPQPSSQKSHSPAPPSLTATSGVGDLDDDESAQLAAEMRQFLGSEASSESSAFPLPPKASSRRSSRRVPRANNGLLAPALPSTTEEEPTPPIPTRSAKRMPSFADESVLPQKPATRSTRYRADSEALHIMPPIASHYAQAERVPDLPTPSDRSERLSAFLGPHFQVGFDNLEINFPTSASTSASQTSQARYDSPSIDTSQASPLTPTFPLPLASSTEKHRPVDIVTNDSASLSEQGSLRAPSALRAGQRSQESSQRRKSKTPKPAHLDLLSPAKFQSEHVRSRMSSVDSSQSASDDVLAAWAELGGVSDNLPINKSRSPMRAR